MSEPKHSNVLLGKSIREIRLRRGLTQREVSEAIRGIRVRCVETGVVYKTITQAAKETGASQAGIRGAASGMAGGYRWEYVDD